MKSLFILFVCVLNATLALAQGQLEAKPAVLNLKAVKADNEPRTEVFKLKNTGNQPVIINRVMPLFSKLKADWSREPIAPGKTTELRITFTPTDLNTERFEYKINVYSNAANKRLELSVTGIVTDNPAKPQLLYKQNIDGLKFKSSHISLGNVFTWQTACDTIYYFNNRNEAVRLGTHYKPAHIEMTFVPTEVKPGEKGAIILCYNATQKNDYGYAYESIVLSINNAKNYNNRLNVSASIKEDFSRLSQKELANAPVASFDRKEVNFGNLKQGEKVDCDFQLTNTGKSPLYVRKTKASCGCTAVTMGNKTIAPGETTTIRATFDSKGKSGRQYKTVTIITNDPKNPEIVLNINGSIVS